jgi:rhodanese-related sulfurtransferase
MPTTADAAVKTVDPRTLQGWLAAGDAVLVDVRERGMYASERIAGATSTPLEELDPSRLPGRPGQRLVFNCQVGVASGKAAARLAEAGRADVYNLAGGLAAWKAAGLPVIRDPGAPMPIARQVQIAAGSMVVVGTLLGATLSPWWLVLSGFIGAGLVFSGATGSCAMAAVLMKLPFNR